MIAETLQQKIAEAMKARDEIRLSTLKLLSSAFNYERIAKQHELNEQEELQVVRQEAKKRQDAIDAFRQAQGKQLNEQVQSVEERLAREEKELAILKEYLPQELSDDELTKIVSNAIASTKAISIHDMGKVMKAANEIIAGRAEGKKIAELVKQALGTGQ